MSFSIGVTIGAYTITDELGKGGMATVYKAHHNKLDRDVAIKVMHPTYSGEQTFIRRFEREARVVAGLEHPHIVPVYDYAVHEGHPYLVMRYIQGETLKDRLNSGNLSKREILRLTDAIADALDYAHREGVLHRDIKPSNILLTPGRGVYITDFGLARVMQSGESTLSQGMIMGTPHYISPEQAKGVGELDGRADIYSFGVILYEMATGRVPFRAESDFSIIHAQIFDAPPLPSMINDDINPRLEMLLLKALEKEPDARYRTAGEMAVALHAALDDMPSNIAPAGAAALPDYTPVAMTQVEMENPNTPSITSETAGNVTGTATTTLHHTDVTPPEKSSAFTVSESVVTEKKGSKRTPALIIGGIIGGIALCICLLLAIGALNDDGSGDDFEETAVSIATPEESEEQEAPSEPDEPNDLPEESPPDLDAPNESDAPPNTDSNSIFVPVHNDRIRPLEELIEMAEENPEDRVLITELAIAYLDAGDWEGAVELVERRFADVRTATPFIRTAEILLENGQIDLAYIVLEEAMYKFSDTPRVLANGQVQRMLLMLNFFFTDPSDDGVQVLLEQLENQPSPENNALDPLAEAYILAVIDGDVESAEEILLNVTEEDHPYTADAYFLLGILYIETERYDDADLALERALKSKPPGWLQTIIEYTTEE